MPEPFSFGGIEVNLVASAGAREGRPRAETPFRLLLVGDFTGRAGRGEPVELEELSARRPLAVDRDNFDDLLRRLAPRARLSLAPGGTPLDIYFDSLEDFHPDRLHERLEIFRALRRTRRKLHDPETFGAAADEVRRRTSTDTRSDDEARRGAETREGGQVTQDAPPEEAVAPPDLLARMFQAMPDEIEASAGRDANVLSDSPDFARFLREVVAPHVTSGPDAQVEELERAVDETVGRAMRAVLHHADFRALEAAWRGVNFLTRSVETGPQLKLHLLDLTREELAADLRSSDDLTRTALYKLLVEQTVGTPGGEPWAVVAGLYTFDATREDAELLGRLAKISDAAGAPFVAAAHPRLAGCDSLADAPDPEDWRHVADAEAVAAWNALRRLPESSRLGLALPRFLLRLPYGAETDPVDSFDFEETEGEPAHDSYLWGNPAFALARLLAESFSRSGWEMRPGDVQQFGGLPLHVYEAGGETRTKPCAEVLLGERAARLLLERGLMPLLSFKDRDDLRLARFQSISDPPTRLAGRWD